MSARKNKPGYEQRLDARKQQAGQHAPSTPVKKGRAHYSSVDEQREHLGAPKRGKQ